MRISVLYPIYTLMVIFGRRTKLVTYINMLVVIFQRNNKNIYLFLRRNFNRFLFAGRVSTTRSPVPKTNNQSYRKNEPSSTPYWIPCKCIYVKLAANYQAKNQLNYNSCFAPASAQNTKLDRIKFHP